MSSREPGPIAEPPAGANAGFQEGDEGTHPVGPQEHWFESYYLNGFDPESGWGMASRIGFCPNQRFADGFVCLFLPDGSTGFIRTWEPCAADHQGRDSVGAIVHRCQTPFQSWKVSYAGPIYHFEEPARMGDFARTMLADVPRREIELELEFEAIHGAFDFHDSMKREPLGVSELLAKLRPSYLAGHLGPSFRKLAMLRSMSGAHHYEHAGRIRGRIAIDGVSHAVSGFGQRDHSWGVRDMRVPSSWRWFSCQVGDEFCFNATQVDLLGMRVSGGYVYHGGTAEALADWSYTAVRDAVSGGPSSVSLELVSRSGRRFDLTGTSLANIPVLVKTGGQMSVVHEAHTRFTWGEKTGYGVSEFMEQLV